MCPRSDGDAELPGITQGKTGLPLSSAAETKPSLVRLGSLKHVAGKSVPENRVRLALNLTLRDLQKIRQGPGSPTVCALLYWDVRGLSETTYQIHRDSLCRGNWWAQEEWGVLSALQPRCPKLLC